MFEDDYMGIFNLKSAKNHKNNTLTPSAVVYENQPFDAINSQIHLLTLLSIVYLLDLSNYCWRPILRGKSTSLSTNEGRTFWSPRRVYVFLYWRENTPFDQARFLALNDLKFGPGCGKMFLLIHSIIIQNLTFQRVILTK